MRLLDGKTPRERRHGGRLALQRLSRSLGYPSDHCELRHIGRDPWQVPRTQSECDDEPSRAECRSSTTILLTSRRSVR